MGKSYEDNEDEMEIDLRELLYEFGRKWWMLFLALVIGGCVTGAYNVFVLTPQYTSSASLYVLSKETTLTSLADLQIGSQLTQDYKVMINSRPVLQEVITKMGLDMDVKELRKKIEIENPSNTRILTISVLDADPYLAKAIVDSISAEAADYIGEIMEMVPPKMIEDGVVATEKTSPSVKRNTVIGSLVALFFVCAVLTVRVVLNDTVKTEEDVRKYLDLPVLAVLPSKGADSEKSNDKKSKKKQKKKTVDIHPDESKRRSSRRKAGKTNGK